MSVIDTSSGKRQRADIDMRAFAKSAGASIKVPPGGVIFSKGETGDCMYIVQSGVIDMMIGDKVIETIGQNEALGFMSMIDDLPRSSTARAREACELSLIDPRTFRLWWTRCRISPPTSWASWRGASAA
jgi:CRP/FNR family cyclic AMP-dependent transcriptional regulator